MHGHHLGVVVLLEIGEQVVLVQVGLVAQADDGGDPQPGGTAEADDGHAHAAALGRQRHRSLDVVGGAERRAQVGGRVVEAVDVGSHDAHVVLARLRQKLRLHLLLAHLGEARRDHHRARNALLPHLGHGGGAELGGHREDGHVHLAGDVLDALVALLPEDLVGPGIDRVELAGVAAVDDVLHHRVADLPFPVRGADDRHGPGVHDALHGRDDLVARRPVGLGLRREIHGHHAVHRGGAAGVRQHRVKIHLADLREIAHQLRDADDDVRQGLPMHRRSAPDTLEDFRRGHAVQHGEGVVACGGGQPEGHVAQHLHQNAAEPEGHHLTEARIGDRTHDDLHALAGDLLLHLDSGQHGVGLVATGAAQQGPVGTLRLLPVRHTHQHATGLGLVQDVLGDDLHHHRKADVLGQIRGLGSRLGNAFPRQRNPVGPQQGAALQRRQRGPSLGPGFMQDRKDLLPPISSRLHLVRPPSPEDEPDGFPERATGGSRFGRVYRVNAPALLSAAISSSPYPRTSLNTSSVCSPSSGERLISTGESESLMGHPTLYHGPRSG